MQNLMNKKAMEKYIGQWVYDPTYHYGIIVTCKNDSYGVAFLDKDKIIWTSDVLIVECPYFLLYEVGDTVFINGEFIDRKEATIEKIHTPYEVSKARYYDDYEAFPFLVKLQDGDILPVGIHEIKKVF